MFHALQVGQGPVGNYSVKESPSRWQHLWPIASIAATQHHRRPNYATIHRMIENPIYGGAYADGKTAAVAGYGAAGVSVKIRRKARGEWLALMPNTHEGYVNWENAETIRKMVSSNVPTSRHRGAPKIGRAHV